MVLLALVTLGREWRAGQLGPHPSVSPLAAPCFTPMQPAVRLLFRGSCWPLPNDSKWEYK